ncbi:hypothetical protein AU14_10640 [Marinobacter similis]|uniref:Uncharacterized protein n=1 Tax=Marinobacter similis TaxID=1420916 RepID=W5YUD0_9GAMM|nr:hypothetical protein AU14_10640 [Marinobacter similis]
MDQFTLGQVWACLILCFRPTPVRTWATAAKGVKCMGESGLFLARYAYMEEVWAQVPDGERS